METPLPVYFIRHNWDAEWQGVVDTLFASKMIGIHYEEIRPPADPFDPNAYNNKKGRAAIRHLNDCSNKSALIVASYRGYDSIYIGLSEVGSKRTQDINNHQIKCLKLCNDVRAVLQNDFPLPFLIAPPFLAMVRWKMGEAAVNLFYRNETLENAEMDLCLLSPWHLEILAEEWLRRKNLLSRKLFKTGSSMKGLDLVGFSPEGKYIVAQVKHSCDEQAISDFFKKVDALQGAAGYFFVSKSKVKDDRIISLETIFEEFRREEPDYLRALVLARLQMR